MATSICSGKRREKRPTYATSSTTFLPSSREIDKSIPCEYGVFIFRSKPQLIAKALLSGVAGKPPTGAGGSNPAGISVTLVNLGALLTLTVPGTFCTWLESPKDPAAL